MDAGVCIRIWTRETVPDRFRHLLAFADDGEIENAVYIAHVPAAMMADRIYRETCGESGLDWIFRRGCGPFGTNAIDTSPHPDGDGILIVGSDA
jgi:hypothetical protein